MKIVESVQGVVKVTLNGTSNSHITQRIWAHCSWHRRTTRQDNLVSSSCSIIPQRGLLDWTSANAVSTTRLLFSWTDLFGQPCLADSKWNVPACQPRWVAAVNSLAPPLVFLEGQEVGTALGSSLAVLRVAGDETHLQAKRGDKMDDRTKRSDPNSCE